MNNNAIKRPTSLDIPSTSPLAWTKFFLAMTAIKNPESIDPTTPARPTKPPSIKAIIATNIVETI